MKTIILHKGERSGPERIRDFVWQHFLLLVSLFFLSFGVALCVRSDMGSSVISSAPYVFTLAGEGGMVPSFTLGMYTNFLNVLLVVGQIVTLRKKFQPIQLLQLAVGIVFGVLIDISMYLTSFMNCDTLIYQLGFMIVGATVMAFGVSLEMRCASITMPGEGLPAAIAKATGKSFPSVKIWVDIILVGLAIVFEFIFFGEWIWKIVGVGTLFAMIYCGMAVKFISARIGWFDNLLGYQPGFRRYIYGLERFIQKKIGHNS